MRWMLLLLPAALGCGGYDGCRDPCPGARTVNYPVYLCDGGPCPAGAANVEAYWQCVCVQGTTGHSLTFKAPTQETCAAARADWNAFFEANCR